MKHAIQNVRSRYCQMLPIVLPQYPPPRPCSEGLGLHQPFDAIQAAVIPSALTSRQTRRAHTGNPNGCFADAAMR